MEDEAKTKEQLIEEVQELRKEVAKGDAAATQLRTKSEQWHLFWSATTNLLWNWNFEDSTVVRSTRFEDSFGYSADEVLPGIEWWVERLHPEDRDRVLGVFESTRAAGHPSCSYKYRFRKRDGSYAHIRDNVFIMYDSLRRPFRALGAMNDITEHVHIEHALRESESKLRVALEDSRLGLMLAKQRQDEGITRAGDATQPYAPDSHATKDAVVMERTDSARRTRQIFSSAEQAMRLSNAIVGTMGEGVVLVGKETGTIMFTNPRFDQMFGYEPGELQGQPISKVNAQDSGSTEAVASDIIGDLERKGSWRGEVRNITKDGVEFWCHATVSTLEHTEFGGTYVAVHSDITEQKRTAQQQKLMSDELDHRVKNNLVSIVSLANQTARGALSVEAFIETFSARLHAMARIHGELAREGWKELDLGGIVKKSVLGAPSALEQVEISGPVYRLIPSKARALGQALHELTTNAAKYGALSTPVGQLSISWQVEGDGSVFIRWSESGGPPAPENPMIGFGLTLVRALVEQEIGGQLSTSFLADGIRHEIRMRHERAE